MIFIFGDCELDTDVYELRRRGIARPIEPQVLDLLLHLARNPHRLITKEELHETIWKGRIVSESALSTRINAARRAIGDRGPEAGYIRTVFRRGFRFVGAVKVREPEAKATESAGEPSSRGAGRAGTAPERRQPGREYLRGHFACYSHASSPVFSGRLIRGSLIVEATSPSSPMRATYSESPAHGILRFGGPVAFSEQVMYLDLTDRRSGERLFLNLLCPGPPGTALLGLMSGKVVHHPSSEIALTRMLAVRVPRLGQTAFDRSNRCLDATGASVSKDLRALGLPLGEASALDALLSSFLHGTHDGGIYRITAADNHAMNVALDSALGGEGRTMKRDTRAPRRPGAVGVARRGRTRRLVGERTGASGHGGSSRRR